MATSAVKRATPVFVEVGRALLARNFRRCDAGCSAAHRNLPRRAKSTRGFCLSGRPRLWAERTEIWRAMMTHTQFHSCIQACIDCALSCESCASACLGEGDVQMMAKCIQLDRDCASFCTLAAILMSRQSTYAKTFCRLCAEVCRACGEECSKHQSDHCQECAKACLACAEECERMAA